MRSTSDIVVMLDGPKAAEDGITFFLSANGVILTHGIDGVLPSNYIKGVISCADRTVVLPIIEPTANGSFSP